MSESEQHSKLYEALAKAQADMKPVTKDGHSFFRMKSGGTVDYKYASTEQIIVIAKEALAANGLAFSRVRFEWGEPIGDAPVSIHSVWRLSHSAGGMMEYHGVWPVIPGLGRPLDKALAASLTSSLGYALRDLLVAPREDEKETMDQRDDGGYQPSAPAKASKPTGTTAQRPEHPLAAPPANKAAFCVAVEKASGMGREDALALAKQIVGKLGVNGDAGPEVWADAIEQVEANKDNLIDWAQA